MSHYISQEDIKQLLQEYNFADVGVTALARPLTIDFYKSWIEEGYNGSMQYLRDHIPFKEEPQKLNPMAQSAIVVLEKYEPHPWPQPELKNLSTCRVASYAKGGDYHHHFKTKLNACIETLKSHFADAEFLCYTDSSPVLERDLAHKAGLGWFGKNSCLLSRKNGSLFFIGEIYTSLNFKTANPLNLPHNHCGTCTKCIDICPTQAIVDEKKVDAKKCISYLTIESRDLPPEELRPQIHDWLFGCDLCQTICPWNLKNYSLDPQSNFQMKPSDKEEEAQLRWILKSSNKFLQKAFKGTAFSRAGGFGLKRNAIIVAANKDYTGLKTEIQTYLHHKKLGELASWALNQFNSKD